MTFFENLRHVLPRAMAYSPSGICYKHGVGWQQYDLTRGVPEGCVPELFCPAPRAVPVALNEHGAAALLSLILEPPK